MKVREGNVFNRVDPPVSYSVHREGGSHVTITHDTLTLGPHYTEPLTLQGQPWTSSNLFTMKHIQSTSR